jgi:putative salt-induced outer membrane protein
MNRRSLALLAIILPASVLAQGESQKEEQSPWTGKVALGYLATSGNTDSSSLNSQFSVGFAHGKWQHTLDATAISSDENDVSTAEAYKLGWKSEYSFSEHDFLFGRAIWRKDRFSGYDQQFSQTVGYGRRVIDTPKHLLSAEIGVGARQSTLRDGSTEDDTIVRGGASYRWKLTETSQFTQDLTVESGNTNTYTESVTAIRTRLLGDFALVASYTLKNNSDVPAGTEKTDTYTALSVEYAF